MATETPGHVFSGLQAEVDMSGTAYQYRFMKHGTAAGQVNRCAAATDSVIGVLKNKPKLGRAASIQQSGTSKVVGGGVVARGTRVQTDSQGRGIAGVAGSPSCGIAKTACAQAGDIFEVELALGGIVY